MRVEGINLRYLGGWNPTARWRWNVIGTPLFGYSATRRSAAAAAREAAFAWSARRPDGGASDE